MRDKTRLHEAEAYAGDRDARITRMNALARAVEYARMVQSQEGRLLSLDEIEELAERFLAFIYEPTTRRIEEMDEGEEIDKEAEIL